MNKHLSAILAIALSLSTISAANARPTKSQGFWKFTCTGDTNNGTTYWMSGTKDIDDVIAKADKLCEVGNYSVGPASGGGAATSGASAASQDNVALSSSSTPSGATRAISAKQRPRR
jgi:hypothetical protein